MTTLGIDIGGSSIKAAVVTDEQIIWTGRSRRYERPDREVLVAALREVASAAPREPAGVGLCVPGVMDESKRQVVHSVNVPGLMDRPLVELLSAAGIDWGQRPIVVGDAYATAFDLFAARKLEGRLFVLAIGTGVGAAVLDDGEPLFVDGESPGHFGQLDVSIAGQPVVGPDGGAGSLEGYLGAAALARRYGTRSDLSSDQPPSSPSLGTPGEGRVGADHSMHAPSPAFPRSTEGGGKGEPVDCIQAGDPALLALVRSIRIAHGLYRPRHVIIAGGVGNRLARLKSEIDAAVRDRLTSIARPGWTLGFGDNDFHAAAGAARLAARGGWKSN